MRALPQRGAWLLLTLTGSALNAAPRQGNTPTDPAAPRQGAAPADPAAPRQAAASADPAAPRQAAASADPAAPRQGAAPADPAALRLSTAKEAVPAMARARRTIGPYQLRPSAHDEYVCETDTFTARITVDGTVLFKDKRPLPGWIALPVIVVAQHFNRRNVGAPGRPGRSPLDPAAMRPMVAVTDEELRRETHHAPKVQFLDATAAFREELQRANDDAALARWRDKVDGVAGNQQIGPVKRKRQVLALWRECDDAQRGAPARALVEAAVRTHLPAGTKLGFTDAELAEINRGLPAERRFEPYAVTRDADLPPTP